MRSGAAAQKEGVWMEGSYLIKCEHLDLGYENQDAVVDVNMEVDPGDYLCIVGKMDPARAPSSRDFWDF